jgi:hypothetical protein
MLGVFRVQFIPYSLMMVVYVVILVFVRIIHASNRNPKNHAIHKKHVQEMGSVFLAVQIILYITEILIGLYNHGFMLL